MRVRREEKAGTRRGGKECGSEKCERMEGGDEVK